MQTGVVDIDASGKRDAPLELLGLLRIVDLLNLTLRGLTSSSMKLSPFSQTEAMSSPGLHCSMT